MQVSLKWAIVMLLLSVAITEGKKDKVGPKPKLPDDKLFNDQAAFCEGCYGLVHEIHKLLRQWSDKKGTLEDHIDAAMLAVCSTERLRAYVLSPPKMERLCSGLRAHYEEELGLAFKKTYGKKTPDVEMVFKEACRKAIPACPKNMKPMSVARKEQREREEAERAAKEAANNSEKVTSDADTKEDQTKKEGKKEETKKNKKNDSSAESKGNNKKVPKKDEL